MSDTSVANAEKPMEQPGNDLLEANGSRSVTTKDSDETSPPKSLSDMPIDVVGLIIERSDYKEQLILRKTSKSLRSLVDEQKPNCLLLFFYIATDHIYVYFGEQKVIYTSPNKEEEYSRYQDTIVVVRDDYEKIAFNDVASTLKNPKLELANFEFQFDNHNWFIENTYKEVQNLLKSVKHQVSVYSCIINLFHASDLLSILPFLKPGELNFITIDFQRNASHWNYGAALKAMEQVESLDQWKNAERIDLRVPFEDFPMRYARHFKRFTLNEQAVSKELLLRIRDYLVKCANFEKCSIFHRDEFMKESIGNDIGTPVPSNKPNEYVIHYSISDSEYYLEILFWKSTFSSRIEIEKKKKNK